MRIFLTRRWHWPLPFVGPTICRAQSPRQIMICHFILSLQTHCKCFNKDCSEVCSSLQQQAAFPASAVVAAAAAAATWAADNPQTLCPLQMCFVQWSHQFWRTVLVYLEAAGTCKRTSELSKRVEKQQCSKSNDAAKQLGAPIREVEIFQSPCKRAAGSMISAMN
jgi:hypothetical protein